MRHAKKSTYSYEVEDADPGKRKKHNDMRWKIWRTRNERTVLMYQLSSRPLLCRSAEGTQPGIHKKMHKKKTHTKTYYVKQSWEHM